jgi:N-formylglutamate amidohydrolase
MKREPFRIEPLQGAPAPVIYDSPHSGRTYPPDFDHVIDLATLRQAEDTHVEALFMHVATQGSPLLHALFPRTWIDVNRALEDIDLDLIDGDWPLPVGSTERGLRGPGLVWSHIGVDGPIYARRLRPEDVLRRIYYCWRPYHEALARLIEGAHALHGRVYHVSCHSMPAFGRAAGREEPLPRPDFCIGDLDGTTCEGDFVRFVRDRLIAAGYQVAVNDPFKGAEVIRRHSDPARGRHSLQLEVNQRLYLDERTRVRNGFFGKLKRDLERLTGEIAEWAWGRG